MLFDDLGGELCRGVPPSCRLQVEPARPHRHHRRGAARARVRGLVARERAGGPPVTAAAPTSCCAPPTPSRPTSPHHEACRRAEHPTVAFTEVGNVLLRLEGCQPVRQRRVHQGVGIRASSSRRGGSSASATSIIAATTFAWSPGMSASGVSPRLMAGCPHRPPVAAPAARRRRRGKPMWPRPPPRAVGQCRSHAAHVPTAGRRGRRPGRPAAPVCAASPRRGHPARAAARSAPGRSRETRQ
jgi:hypothetical protein